MSTAVGHGIDVVEIATFARLLTRNVFVTRSFSETERAQAREANSETAFLAGRFAAKEAVLKALRSGLVDGVSLLDIEIRSEASGAPYVVLRGQVALLAEERGITTLLVSIAHTETIAIASAIATGLP